MTWPCETGVGRGGACGGAGEYSATLDAETTVEWISSEDGDYKEKEHLQNSRSSSAGLPANR